METTKEHADDSSGELIQLVSFMLGEEEFGVHVLKVREIIRMPEITRVPNTPNYVEGVINLRGKVIPVMSMRNRFGLEEREYDKQTRIMVMEVDSELMGFIVDSVSEVIRISEHEIQPPPAVASTGVDHECLSGIISQRERLLVLLDLEKVSCKENQMLLTM